jgi:uncharacterized protein (DUF1697 family)
MEAMKPSPNPRPAAGQRCVALLRGINVGRGQRLPMAELASLLADLGCTGVRTLLNSGNAVFDSATAPSDLALQLHAAIRQRLDLEVPVQVRSAACFRAIVDGNPLLPLADDASRLLVAFPAPGQTPAALSAWRAPAGEGGALHIGAHAAYLWCPQGVLESPLASALLGKAGAQFTTRNWATVSRIAAAL